MVMTDSATRIQLEMYQKGFLANRSRYDRYPQGVTIETLALCNAACSFCPYPTLERKGTRMETALVEKIIDDLTAIPPDHSFYFNLSRINEPFLDTRLFDFKQLINRRIPQAELIIITNGSMLNDRNLDRLESIQNIKAVNVSFNDHRPEHYQKVMRLPYERTVQNLRRLHLRLEKGKLKFVVWLSRVVDGSEADAEFLSWAEKEFPLFTPVNRWRTDWMGLVQEGLDRDLDDVGCQQWFKLHFLADGREAFCCFDGVGQYAGGDIRTTHALDIYNHPEKQRIRREVTARRDVGICKGCPFLG